EYLRVLYQRGCSDLLVTPVQMASDAWHAGTCARPDPLQSVAGHWPPARRCPRAANWSAQLDPAGDPAPDRSLPDAEYRPPHTAAAGGAGDAATSRSASLPWADPRSAGR